MHPRTERINSLQAFRALAAILVVFNHATVFSRALLGMRTFEGDNPLSKAASVLFFGNPQANIRVDIFFVVSGFMVYYAYEKYLGKTSEIRTYLLRRVIRIYPLLWVFTLSKVALIALIPSRAKSYENGWTMIASLLALPQEHEPLVAAAWTLPLEMIFYLVFGLAVVLGLRAGIVMAAVWGLAIVALNLIVSLGHVNLASDVPFPLVLGHVLYERNLEFLFGCAAAYMLRRKLIERAGPLIGLGLIGLIFSGALMIRGVAIPSFALMIGLPAVLLVAGTVLFELQRRPQIPRPLTLIGDASYSIFLSHSTFINILMLPLLVTGWRPTEEWLLMLVVTVVATTGGVLVYLLFERPVLEYLRRRLVEPRRGAPAAEPALARAEQVSVSA